MSWKWMLALGWMTVWALAANAFLDGAAKDTTEAEHLGRILTGVHPDMDVRVEGRIAAAPAVEAPFTRTPCVAAEMNIHYVTSYLDAQDKTQFDSRVIETRRVGPTDVAIDVGDARLLLPLDLWNAQGLQATTTTKDMHALPAELHVKDADVQAAKAKTSGSFYGFSITETRLHQGQQVFVAGHTDSAPGPDGALRLEVDRVLHRVEVFGGTQAERIAKMHNASQAGRVFAWVVLVLGAIPSVILLLLKLRKKKA